MQGRLKTLFLVFRRPFMFAAFYQYTSGSETVLWSRAER